MTRVSTRYCWPCRSPGKHSAAVCGPPASSARQQTVRAGLRLCGQLRSDAGQHVRAEVEGLQHNWVRYRAERPSTVPASSSLSIVAPACEKVTSGAPFPQGQRPGRAQLAQLDTLKHWQMGLTPPGVVIENEACMTASLQIAGLNGDTKLVTNSVTNRLGNSGNAGQLSPILLPN